MERKQIIIVIFLSIVLIVLLTRCINSVRTIIFKRDKVSFAYLCNFTENCGSLLLLWFLCYLLGCTIKVPLPLAGLFFCIYGAAFSITSKKLINKKSWGVFFVDSIYYLILGIIISVVGILMIFM